VFVRATTDDTRLKLYRDVLAVFKSILSSGLEAYGIDTEAVIIKNTVDKNVNRAPLIVLERGDMQHVPRSLMFGEKITADLVAGTMNSHTAHMIEYPIEITCYGNSYLESEKLGGLAMEAILTTGLAIIKQMHPNIIGSEFIGWGKSGLVEGKDSSLVSCTVLGKVFLKIEGYYSIQN